MKKLFLVFLIFLTSCTITSNVVYEPESEIEVYFCPEDMCLEKYLDLINSSKDIKCAFYDLDLGPLIDALERKGAEVIIEDSNSLEGFLTGYSSALMHNKFCIFDSSVVITGSMNPTERGNYYNNNNILIIRSDAVAENYLQEYYELKNDVYGKGGKVLNPEILIGDIKLENYFCPEDKCKLQVINALQEAQESIYFMTFSFTDEDIGNLLWNKDYLGLDVKGVFEQRQISDYSRYADLKEFSILDSNKYTMHHKVFIIDNETVITGSYNPTQNADQRNDENLLIIHDSTIAKKFLEEFKKVYGQGTYVMPNVSGEAILNEILYDAEGSDTGKEYVVIKNTGQDKISLDYYFISDNKTNSRLSGILLPEESIKVYPKFSMKNSEGMLFLKKNDVVSDYIFWEGVWSISAEAGETLFRTDTKQISQESWQVFRR